MRKDDRLAEEKSICLTYVSLTSLTARIVAPDQSLFSFSTLPFADDTQANGVT